MVDPKNLPDTWTQDKLEEFILFAIAVAGHNANNTAKALDKILRYLGWPSMYDTPFEAIRDYRAWESYDKRRVYLEYIIEDAGMGCYSARSESFMQIAHSDINLRTCTPGELEEIRGIGPKTSRFFIMYTRPEEANSYAVLDRHILRWLTRKFGIPTPQNTPSSTKRYTELEQLFLQAASDAGMSARALDTMIWQYRMDTGGTYEQ